MLVSNFAQYLFFFFKLFLPGFHMMLSKMFLYFSHTTKFINTKIFIVSSYLFVSVTAIFNSDLSFFMLIFLTSKTDYSQIMFCILLKLYLFLLLHIYYVLLALGPICFSFNSRGKLGAFSCAC